MPEPPATAALTRALIAQRLRDHGALPAGADLPTPPKPLATYVPFRVLGRTVYISGQLPLIDGKLMTEGRVPEPSDLATAQQCAARCAVNALAALEGALLADADADTDTDADAHWGRLLGVARVGVFVASADGFTQQHLVANGASEAIAAALGEPGRHARAAVGVPCLPLGAPVEVELTAHLRD